MPSIDLARKDVGNACSVWNMNRPCSLEPASLPPAFSADMHGNSDFDDEFIKMLNT